MMLVTVENIGIAPLSRYVATATVSEMLGLVSLLYSVGSATIQHTRQLS